MKSIRTVLLIAASLTLITGCNSSNKSETSTKEVGSTIEESKETKEENGASLEDGVLDLGISVDFPPYEFYEGNEIVGIDAEISEAISKKLGYELKLHDMDFSAIVASIEGGKLDGGISGFTVTEERAQKVNFSDTYAQSVQQVLVKKGSEIKTIDDMKDKKIGTQLGSTGDIFAQDDFGKDNVQAFSKFPDAVLALQNDKIDAILLDQQTAEQFAAANNDLEILDTTYAEEEYAIAITKDNEALLKKVNEAIAELKNSGDLQKIIDKYIKAE